MPASPFALKPRRNLIVITDRTEPLPYRIGDFVVKVRINQAVDFCLSLILRMSIYV
jgi:hypothetical protein